MTVSFVGGEVMPHVNGDIPGAGFVGNRKYMGGVLFDVYSATMPSWRLGKGIVSLAIPIPLTMGLEIGALNVPRNYSESGGPGPKVTVNATEYPLLLHFSFGYFFKFGIGGYYLQSRYIQADAGAQSSGLVYQPPIGEWGGLGSVGINLLPHSWVGVWADARYTLSVTNVSNAGDMKFNDVQALVGLRFGKME